MSTGVRVLDQFIDIFPAVAGELISLTMHREGYDSPGSFGGLFIEGAGAIAMEMEGSPGRVRTVNVTAGSNINGRVRKILSTGTTATGISIMII